jgi:hypothetical protein
MLQPINIVLICAFNIQSQPSQRKWVETIMNSLQPHQRLL